MQQNNFWEMTDIELWEGVNSLLDGALASAAGGEVEGAPIIVVAALLDELIRRDPEWEGESFPVLSEIKEMRAGIYHAIKND